MKKTTAVLIAIILISSLSAAVANDTSNAYFSDTEVSLQNSLSAWSGEDLTECGGLNVITEDAKLTGDGRKLFKIALETSDSTDTLIDNITISWLDDSGEKTKKIKIGGTTFWKGSESSGESLDGNYTLLQSESKWFSAWFDSDMHGKNFSITFFAAGCAPKTIELGPFYKNHYENNPCGLGNGGDDSKNCKHITTHLIVSP